MFSSVVSDQFSCLVTQYPLAIIKVEVAFISEQHDGYVGGNILQHFRLVIDVNADSPLSNNFGLGIKTADQNNIGELDAVLLQIGNRFVTVAAKCNDDHIAGPNMAQDVEETRRLVNTTIKVNAQSRFGLAHNFTKYIS